MKTMVYKAGGETLVWGTAAHVKVISREDLARYLSEGWLDHPSKLFESARNQEPETDGADLIGEDGEPVKKRGRKPKADADEIDD